MTLPTNVKVARFDSEEENEIIRRLEKDIDAMRFDAPDGKIELPTVVHRAGTEEGRQVMSGYEVLLIILFIGACVERRHVSKQYNDLAAKLDERDKELAEARSQLRDRRTT